MVCYFKFTVLTDLFYSHLSDQSGYIYTTTVLTYYYVEIGH